MEKNLRSENVLSTSHQTNSKLHISLPNFCFLVREEKEEQNIYHVFDQDQQLLGFFDNSCVSLWSCRWRLFGL